MKKILLIVSLGLVVVLSAIFLIDIFVVTKVAGKTYAYDSFTIQWLNEEDKDTILNNKTEEEFLDSMQETLKNMYENILLTFEKNGSITIKNTQTEQSTQETSYVQENKKIYIYKNDELISTYHIEKNKFYYEQERDIDSSGEAELIIKMYFKKV